MNKILLLVDDSEHDVFLTCRALKKNNIAAEIVIAAGGQQALDYLFGCPKYPRGKSTGLPAVVLLDLKMPKIDGFDVLKMIRSNPKTRNVPVVILTASKEEKDIAACYAAGCNAYVTKPVDFNEFSEVVRQLGFFWLGLNEISGAEPANFEQ